VVAEFDLPEMVAKTVDAHGVKTATVTRREYNEGSQFRGPGSTYAERRGIPFMWFKSSALFRLAACAAIAADGAPDPVYVTDFGPQPRVDSMSDCTLNKLDDAQALWARAGIANYEFTVSQYGFVVPGDIMVKVRGGMPQSVTWLPQDRRWPTWTHHVSRRIWHTLPLTADDLFSLVREHIRQYSEPSSSIDCIFNPDTGFLESMSAMDTRATDSEYLITIGDFQLLR